MRIWIWAAIGGCGLGVDPADAPEMGLRRLSVHEYDNTVRDVLGDESRPGRALLPADRLRPFDNDSTTQDPSLVLIEATESLATSIAADLVSDPERLAAVLPCEPSGANDAECLAEYASVVGRRLLRRPVSDEHVDRLVDLAQTYMSQDPSFEAGVDLVTRALLQDPGFLYRIEIGEPVPGHEEVAVLDGFEVASRLAYFLWGAPPDDALLDAAADGGLTQTDDIREQAERMLAMPAARSQIDRFHALWLGYHQLPHEAWMTGAMRTETRAMMERVVFDEGRPWTELWTMSEHYLEPALAEHYGVDASSTDAAWVTMPTDRQGLLGTGAFLSVGSVVGDTSPTRRGKLIRERLFCSPVPPPPPGVDADNPPSVEIAECKADRYVQHQEDPNCASCHAMMDPIGFGLEQYDRTGVVRTHDEGAPQCTIDGLGAVEPWGSFSGPRELARLALDNGLDACAVDHVLQFALGRPLQSADHEWLATLTERFRAADQDGQTHDLRALLLDIVTSPGFVLRREESP